VSWHPWFWGLALCSMFLGLWAPDFLGRATPVEKTRWRRPIVWEAAGRFTPGQMDEFSSEFRRQSRRLDRSLLFLPLSLA
jgi:hypothetical protein